MFHLYGMPHHEKGTKVNPTAPEGAEFYEPENESLVVVAVSRSSWSKPRLRVLRYSAEPGVAPGEKGQWTTDTGLGYREKHSDAEVVGYVAPGGKVVGEVPNKPLPYYHAK